MTDDLADLLGASFQVTHRPNNPDAPHPRFSQYKSQGYGKFSQEERQKEFLSRQKQRRFDFLQHVRRLAEDDWVKDKDADAEKEDEAMDTQAVSRPGPRYKDQLLLSEWMLEVPPDFAEWLMVPCPVGRRSLVVASRGQTKAYRRNGYLMNSFRSCLPGGSKNLQYWMRENAILDCIYVEALKTYFILDLMCWKNHPVYDSDTEFRFFWAAQKLSECPEVQEISSSNQYKFHLLPQFPCQPQSLLDAMKTPMTTPLDGLLFYHKSSHYTFGASPLVLWLKAYMMPELLGVPVPDNYMKEMPSSYQNFAHHVETVDRDEYTRAKVWPRGGRRNKMEMGGSPGAVVKEGHGKGRGRHRKKQVAMDTAEPKDGEECDIEIECSPASVTKEGHSKKQKRRKKKRVAMDTTQTVDSDGEEEIDDSSHDGNTSKTIEHSDMDNSESVNGKGTKNHRDSLPSDNPVEVTMS